MSASVFVSLFFFAAADLFCVCDFATNFSFSWGQVCERSVLISLQQLAAPLATCHLQQLQQKWTPLFVASAQMTNALKGAAGRRGRGVESADCGSCSSVFVNMKLSAPTRGTVALVSVLYNIQFHLRILQNAERSRNRNRNESKQ